MEIVVAEPEQVDAMVAITEQARANMAAMGIDQWQCGYPDRGTWEADVGGRCRLCCPGRGTRGGCVPLRR